MANILLVWELGAGLGHLGRLLALGHQLSARRHRVALASRDPAAAARVQGMGGIEMLAAPTLDLVEAIAEPANHAEVLIQFGLDDGDRLALLVAEWRRCFDDFRPDVVVLDYSPVALLALQGQSVGRILFGTGFASPPDRYPLDSLRPWQDHYPDRLLFSEARLLDGLNAVLAGLGQPSLAYVAELYRRVDLNVLATFPELDHYAERGVGDFRGIWSLPDGSAPAWPATKGKRVFAYLNPMPALFVLADCLKQLGAAALFYVPGLEAGARQRLAEAGVRCADRPVDMAAVATEADFAILHAGHSTTAALLLAGKPVLALPTYAEQFLMARAVAAMGAGLNVVSGEADALCMAMRRLHDEPAFRVAAEAFRDRHAGHDPEREAAGLVRDIEALGARMIAARAV